jgi:cytidyltransferase-like protein
VCCLTVGCFDMFHRGHAKLLHRLTTESDKLIIGVHDDESIWQNKNTKVAWKATKRFTTVQLALRPQDEAFIIHAQDPTPYWVGGTDSRGRQVESLLEKARSQGWDNFEYKRGDDMLNFPGREALEKEGVKVKFLPYTQGVSSSKMRKMWGLNLQVLPDVIANPVLDVHEAVIYKPLRITLEKVAALRFFPSSVTPNMVTWTSMLCAIPFVLLNLYGFHVAACVLCVAHDMLDRLDGAVAGSLRKRADVKIEGPKVYRGGVVVHDGEYGAYLDAMGDKAFGITALLVLCFLPGLPIWWKTIAILKVPLHVALSVVRTQDYRAKLRGETAAALPAVGVGKLATCAENFGCAVAALALGIGTDGVTILIAGVLSALSIDMAARSLSHKLRARC